MGNLCDCVEPQHPPEDRESATKLEERESQKPSEPTAEEQPPGKEEEPAPKEPTPEPEPAKKEDETPQKSEPEPTEEPQRSRKSSSSSSSSSSDEEKKKEAEQKEPTPEPVKAPTPEPVKAPTPEPVKEPTPEPEVTIDVVPQPAPEVVVVEQQEEEEEEEEEEAAVAGAHRLMRPFAEGNVILLRSQATGQNLRIVNGEVEGRGGCGKKAQFTVHVKRHRVVALQNVKDPGAWLKIDDDKLSGDGTGDEFCEFKLEVHGGDIVLESVKFPGQHVGITPDGNAKPPSQTGTGAHAQFAPSIQSPTVAGEGELLQLFETGNRIVLKSAASGKSLRAVNGEVDGIGGEKKKAQFTVEVRRNGVVALRNVKDPSAWLRIFKDRLEAKGEGGKYTEFKVEEVEGYVVLESVAHPGQHVGIRPDGEAKKPSNTGTGEHARFTPILKPLVAGSSELLSRFAQGNVIVLKSQASEKTLRFRKGIVEGRGGNGALAQFTVFVRGADEGVVSLRNVKDPTRWLRIFNNELLSTGKGYGQTHFKLEEIDGEFVCLESVKFPGCRVGVLPDGSIKDPDKTGTGPHGQFVPIVIDEPGGDDEDDEEEEP